MCRDFPHHRIRHVVKTLTQRHRFNRSIVYLNHVTPRTSLAIEIIVYDGSRRLIGLRKADTYFGNEWVEAQRFWIAGYCGHQLWTCHHVKFRGQHIQGVSGCSTFGAMFS